jgi:signal transduction histidine kinase
VAGNNFQAEIAALGKIEAVSTILDVVCRATGMGFAAVARVTEDRWIACSVRDEISFGLEPGGELQVETTICHEIREKGQPVIIDSVSDNRVYCRHPTPARYGFQSYISYPIIRADGTFFGTLCAIDPKPAHLNTPATTGMFKLFAELIAFHLDAVERLASTEARLSNEREASELREQFIAVLGHDLRNPLAAISAGAELLAKAPLDTRASRMVAIIQQGASRMSGLIDDVMDFARGRLGGGLSVERSEPIGIEPVLKQVIAELRATWPNRPIEEDFSLIQPVSCDPKRLSQLFSNLLANALTHGAADHPVLIRAITDAGWFELSVANAGEPIPQAAVARLFQPFARGSMRPSQQGLGLGLYIASEIARAHGGTLKAESSARETRFTFRMPLQ